MPTLNFLGGDHAPTPPTRAALEKTAAEWFDLMVEHQLAAAVHMAEGAIEHAVSELDEAVACGEKARAALAEAIAPPVGPS